MGLIDADELKKKYQRFCRMYGLKPLWKFIDNAPTVEPCYQTTSCLDCKMYDKEKHNCPRFCEVIRSAIEERPKGEFTIKELEGWLHSFGYSDGTVEDMIDSFTSYAERKKGEE